MKRENRKRKSFIYKLSFRGKERSLCTSTRRCERERERERRNSYEMMRRGLQVLLCDYYYYYYD